MQLNVNIKNLDLQIGKNQIFTDLTFSLENGSFNTIIGLSGAGKTQLLRTLADLNSKFQTSPIPHAGVSFVFQKSSLFGWLTVAENLRVATKRSEAEIAIFLEKVHLEHYSLKYPHQLSTGMQQKVNLLRAFLVKAPIVLMDEPFTGLDHANKIQLYEQLLNLWRERQTTVLFVTHDIHEALILSEKIFLLSKKKKQISQTIGIPFPYPRKIIESNFEEFYNKTFDTIENFLVDDLT